MTVNHVGFALSEITEELDNTYVKKFDNSISDSSIRRAKKKIREYGLCNDFQYFVTLTVSCKNADRFSVDSCQTLLKKKLEYYKRVSKDFKYLLITEKHKNGALHFHGLMKGIREKDLYKNSNNFFSHKYFDKIGYNSFSLIKDYYKCINYITKYITKEAIYNSSHYLYINSRGLKTPDEFVLKENKLSKNIDFDYSNSFSDILDFNVFDEKYSELIFLLSNNDIYI